MNNKVIVERGVRSGEVSVEVRDKDGKVIGHESKLVVEQLEPVAVKHANVEAPAPTIVTDNSKKDVIEEPAKKPATHGDSKRPAIHQHTEFVKHKLDSASVGTTRKDN